MGCGGCIVLVLVIGAIVAAAMSIAALVDPFSWMPPIGDVFADCPPAVEVNGSCELEDRYPGFWLHVLVNLAYSAAAVALPRRGGARRRGAARRPCRALRWRCGRGALPGRARTPRAVAVPTAALALLPLVVAVL